MLFPGGHVLDLHHPLGDLILPQEGHIGDAQLIGVAHFPFELLLFPIDLGPDAPLAELRGKGDGGGEVLRHGEHQHISRGSHQACR